MVMIRCPECGQRVLDVASACPRCQHVLIQNPLETHRWGTLRECGRCGKHIARDLVICPYCGHHVRAARLAWRATVATATVLVVGAVGIVLWRSGVIPSLRDGTRSAGPPAVEPRAAEPAPPPADTVRAPPVVAVTPEPANRDSGAVPTPAAPGPAVRTPAVEAQGPAPPQRELVTRWTLDWANVRAARSVEAMVVQVLPPGRAIRVREMREGWWALYTNGAVVGYIANSVLTNTPPG